jgi:hypothetical protein
MSPLQTPKRSGRQSLFIVRAIWSTQTLCRQNADILNAQAGGTYSNHWALKG